MTLSTEDHIAEPPQVATQGELVHWMGPDRMQLAPVGIAATAVAAVACGLAAVAAFRYLAPRREGLPPWRSRRVLH